MSIKKGSKTIFIGFNNIKHVKADSLNNLMKRIEF